VNIFEASHALLEIELAAQEHGVSEAGLVNFLMWVAEEKFPAEAFDDLLIAKLLSGMKEFVAEYGRAVDKEIEGSLSFSETSL
jgi:hypothetical protein